VEGQAASGLKGGLTMNHMNGKTIGILATAAVLAIVAAVALNSARKPATESSRESSYAIPELRGHVNDVNALLFTGAEGKTLVTLVKAEKGWRVKEKGEYPADTGKLRELLLKLADAALVEPKTSNEQRYAELGVDDPAGSKEPKGTQVTIEGLSKPVQMIIGTPSSRGDGTFVRRVGDKQSWLAKGDLSVEKDPSGWLERDLADISASRVAEVTVNRPNGKPVRIYKEGSGDANFKLADLPKGRELNPDDSVKYELCVQQLTLLNS
jgi:hypothetical protein